MVQNAQCSTVDTSSIGGKSQHVKVVWFAFLLFLVKVKPLRNCLLKKWHCCCLPFLKALLAKEQLQSKSSSFRSPSTRGC